MPNWCSNTLIVSGLDIDNFRDDVKDENTDLTFSSLIPYPDFEGTKLDDLVYILSENQMKQCLFSSKGNFDWYSYCCDKWGTKWDANEIEFEQEDEQLIYHFSTAWSPPVEWVKSVSKWYRSTFELTGIEEGCDFWYHLEIEDGIVIDEKTLTIFEKILVDNPNFMKIKMEFIEKLCEIEYDEDLLVEDIDELRDIVDILDCEFNNFYLYQIFDEYRKGYYALKKLVKKVKYLKTISNK